eukprot:TRINITY_DN10926_c0_g1_i2.p1 TRINITY_DN10926_c0_g1~~TRINITY_DN10926_c0_g1_i2.p1  ORF type:complete len:430 (+),score=75.85 TRINITY_DN10926_c0_g1_i2:90-1379(+)
MTILPPLLLLLSLAFSSAGPTQTTAHNHAGDLAHDESTIALSVVAIVAFVAILAMCAGSKESAPASAPNGAMVQVASEPPAFRQPAAASSRAPMPAPVQTPTAATPAPAAVNYGKPMAAPTQVAAPTALPQAYVRDLVNGQVSYREVSLEEADRLIAQGVQVFRPSDRDAAGQDIYEAVSTSNDLYASVNKTKGPNMDLYAAPIKPTSASSLGQDLYATPAKKSANGPGKTAAASSAIETQHDYELAVYSTPAVAPPLAAKAKAGPVDPSRRKSYVNADVVEQQKRAKEDQIARDGAYLPQAIQPTPSEQMVYEPVETSSNDLELWMHQGLTRDQCTRFLAGKPSGTYIVRRSVKDGSFVLSMSGSVVYNFKIIEESGQYHILDDKNPQPPRFNTIPALIEHFKRIDPKAIGGLPVRLTEVLPFSEFSA